MKKALQQRSVARLWVKSCSVSIGNVETRRTGDRGSRHQRSPSRRDFSSSFCTPKRC